MAKVTDLGEIQQAVTTVYETIGCSLDEYIETKEVIDCISMIYVNNDRQTGLGQDFEEGISVVASRTRISIIGQGAMSFYKNDGPICQYENIVADVEQIITVMDAAIARWQYNLL